MEILHKQKTILSGRYDKNVFLTCKKHNDKTYSSAERQPDPPAGFSSGSTAQFSEMPLCCSSHLPPRRPNTLTSETSASSSARSSQNHRCSPQAAGKWSKNLNICDCCSCLYEWWYIYRPWIWSPCLFGLPEETDQREPPTSPVVICGGKHTSVSSSDHKYLWDKEVMLSPVTVCTDLQILGWWMGLSPGQTSVTFCVNKTVWSVIIDVEMQ